MSGSYTVMTFLVDRTRREAGTAQCLLRHVFFWALLACESFSKQMSVRQGEGKQT